MKTIAVLGTLDTKGEQILFVREQIEALGHRAVLIDTGTREGSADIKPDISFEDVARAAGMTAQEIRSMKDRQKITSLVIAGAISQSRALLAEGRLDGIMAVGGASAATVGSAVMHALPFGVPKLIVSSAAGMQAYSGRWFGTSDITMINTIVDIVGLNGLVRNVLRRSVGAICGMAENASGSLATLLAGGDRPLIAMTEDGSSEHCATVVRQLLAAEGFDVVNFHAQGISDRAMEELFEQGFFDGVVDIALVGVSDELFEGNRPGGPKRLEMAGLRGIPQVLAPCGLNMTGAGPTRKNSEKYSSRPRMLKIDDLRMGTRLDTEELLLTARILAEKLNKAKGPVRFYFPSRGWSGFDPPGGVLCCPEEDQILVRELRSLLKGEIEVIEVDAHLEEPVFAQVLAEGMTQLMKSTVTA
ncbi:MAG: Tm-1-like ATP-binding domain-containing protein [Thermoleophilia bacterium]